MLLLVVAMYHLTSLQPNASFDYFAWARVYQMVAMPFLLVPITTLSYAICRRKKPPRPRRSSTWPATSAAASGTDGDHRAGATLAAPPVASHRLVPSSPQYQSSLQQAAAHFAAQGAAQPDARHQAIGWLGQLVQNQASIMSYIDVFWIFAVIAVLLIHVALLILRAIRHRTDRGLRIGHRGGTRPAARRTERRRSQHAHKT